MRWVVVQPGPSFSVHDLYVGWVEALRALGQRVVGYNMDERLTFYDAALLPTDEPGSFRKALTAEQSYELAVNGLYATLYQVRPDVLFVVSGFFIPPRLLDRVRRTGTRVVLLHTESPYEEQRQLELAQWADLNLTTDPTYLELYRRIGPAAYTPHAYRPAVHHPGPAVRELESDLAFVGTGYPSRVAFLEAMDLDGVDVLLGGNWPSVGEDSPLWPYLAHEPGQCVDNERAVDVYRSAKVGLNLYRREAQRADLVAGWSMGPREVEMAACGLFFLRDHRPEGDEVLAALPAFTSPDEASDLLRWWLAHPDERAERAALAREAVADRTFDRHAAQLLKVLDD